MGRHGRRRTLLGFLDRRARVLQAAQDEQAREHRAAVRRILQEATRPLPTVRPPSAPLLTRGQAARSGGRR